MYCFLICLLVFHVISSNGITTNRTDDFLDLFLHYDEMNGGYPSGTNSCSHRLHLSLEKLRKRQTPITTSGYIDLTDYALHQTLRHAPFDMYVTDIKVRTPGVGNWVRVEKCQFSNLENRLVAELLFNDLSVTGNVRLFENSISKNPGQQMPVDFCSMTVRLKRAGLGINAFPARGRSRGIDVKTEARFVDPNYLSVHAYGCKLSQVVNRNVPDDYESGRSSHRYLESQLQQNLRFKQLMKDIKKSDYLFQEKASETPQSKTDPAEGTLGVRIITLAPHILGNDEALSTVQLESEDETNLNSMHKERILSAKFQNERDKLQAVLHVKNLIAQQANKIFQTHGPFANHQLMYNPEENTQTVHQIHNIRPIGVISTITELDHNLAPVRPIQSNPPGTSFAGTDDKNINVNGQNIQITVEDLSREMEDMFLRGIKTLLTKYLEKQLEIPLKEALMVSIGYTVSYGR